MIKRIVDISEQAFLHVRHHQLVVDKEGVDHTSIPIEDLGVLVLDSPAITMTQAAVVACQQHNVAVIFCDKKHLPYSVVLPLVEGHTLHQKVLHRQVQLKPSRAGQLWKAIVQRKIKEQADNMTRIGQPAKALARLVKKVKSGDRENHEAQAARLYWQQFMGCDFRRDKDAGGVNAILNYGYAVLRAMIARALVSGGFHPALGLHHRNQFNGYCLADDLMEPFRPWVDWIVAHLQADNAAVVIDRESKAQLLGLMSEGVLWMDKTMPFMVAVQYLVANLKRCYESSSERLCFPRWERRLPVQKK